MSRQLLALVATLAALLTVPVAGTRSTFIPDWTFKGSTLTGWHVVGAADWKAVDGELVGTPKSAEGGWLVLDKSFQDVEFGADFKCVGECRTGVLLRAEKTPTGMKGVFLPRRRRNRRLCRDVDAHAGDARAPAAARLRASRHRRRSRRRPPPLAWCRDVAPVRDVVRVGLKDRRCCPRARCWPTWSSPPRSAERWNDLMSCRRQHLPPW
jgi:hypothetical protein